MVREPDATMQPTLQDNQPMSKHRVLSFKPQLRLEWRGQDGQSETEQPDHTASLGDSITSSTRIRFSVHTGSLPLDYGIGVHVGDVMYGNIGSRTRLDFAVIGPAVNMASRLETLTKQLGRTVLLSRAFADFVESDFDLERVGEYPVRGFNDPIELFAYHG